MTGACRRRRRDERGNAVVELVWLGLLLLVPLIWIVLSVFEVQRGAFGVSAAARSAGRAFALSPDDATGLHRAQAAADVALADQGVQRAWTLSVTCPPRPDCHTGGAVVVRVESSVSLPFLPKALGDDATFALSAEHTVPIGQYQEPGQ
jgi:Flp pilus assembly protein TadG